MGDWVQDSQLVVLGFEGLGLLFLDQSLVFEVQVAGVVGLQFKSVELGF